MMLSFNENISGRLGVPCSLNPDIPPTSISPRSHCDIPCSRTTAGQAFDEAIHLKEFRRAEREQQRSQLPDTVVVESAPTVEMVVAVAVDGDGCVDVVNGVVNVDVIIDVDEHGDGVLWTIFLPTLHLLSFLTRLKVMTLRHLLFGIDACLQYCVPNWIFSSMTTLLPFMHPLQYLLVLFLLLILQEHLLLSLKPSLDLML